MSLHQDAELKKAVLDLPQKEKDKLLVRLISKDKMLIKQLHFQLLENEYDLEDRIEKLRQQLAQLFDIGLSQIANTPHHSNFIALSKLVKQASGLVNEHEKVTKDKNSEVEFRCYILKRAIADYDRLFDSSYQSAAHKLHKYITGRIKHAVGKFSKLHEDFQFDYREDFQNTLDAFGNTTLKSYISEQKIDIDLN
ncbi:MAG: hypothetical protein LBJ04_17100 [Sphingobacterium sp.]|jgi:cell division septum initiation protein DivIVA|uniref:hypothetical protein n=1 Tax=Sphingobacterium sp. TaxID=341027 RepID=UPI002832DA96|nr:hypothetical protein [Sphingobacterium sp.]MDR0264938.1 hypothetical protein [Sphingobacterium sp.]